MRFALLGCVSQWTGNIQGHIYPAIPFCPGASDATYIANFGPGGFVYAGSLTAEELYSTLEMKTQGPLADDEESSEFEDEDDDSS